MSPPLNSDEGDAIRTLRSALAEQASSGMSREASARPAPERPQDSTPAVDALRELLNGDSTPSYSVANRSVVPHGRAEPIKNVLGDASARTAKAEPAPSNERRANPGQSASSVSTVLESSRAEKHAAAMSSRRRAPSANRDEASTNPLDLQNLAHANDLPNDERNSESAVGQPLRWLALLVIVVIGAWAWWSHRPMPSEPPSELAAFVDKLGREVAEKGLKNGALPERLAGLSGFPQEALEMPIEYYSARLQKPRLEVFYLHLSAGEFALIGRYADSAWMYTSGEANPLRAVPPYSF